MNTQTPQMLQVSITPSTRKGGNGHWKSEHVLTCGGGRYRFGLGYVDSTGVCRREYMGPEVPGPHGFAYGLSWAITSDPRMSTGAAIRSNEEKGIEHPVEEGDLVRFADDVFRVHIDRGEWIELAHVGVYGFTSDTEG